MLCSCYKFKEKFTLNKILWTTLNLCQLSPGHLEGKPLPAKCWVTFRPSPISWSTTHGFKQPKELGKCHLWPSLVSGVPRASVCPGFFCYRGQWFLCVSQGQTHRFFPLLASLIHYQLSKASSGKLFHIISSYLSVTHRILPPEEKSQNPNPSFSLSINGLGLLTHFNSGDQHLCSPLFWTTPLNCLIR